jgi:hypothetical protein
MTADGFTEDRIQSIFHIAGELSAQVLRDAQDTQSAEATPYSKDDETTWKEMDLTDKQIEEIRINEEHLKFA